MVLFRETSDVDDISDWLEAIDQGFYVNAFAANGIDGHALMAVRTKGELPVHMNSCHYFIIIITVDHPERMMKRV